MRFRAVATLLLCACVTTSSPRFDRSAPLVVVLGIAQDGGYPQAGCNAEHCERGWRGERRRVASLAIFDPASDEKWLLDATPDFPDQLRSLDAIGGRNGVQGIFLTHAHVGHYAGLIHLGREVIGAREVPVYAMPRMRAFLQTNGPWDQLVRLRNIVLREMADSTRVPLNERVSVTPFRVPHRDEYSETVGFRIDGPSRSIVFIPDIDKWEKWDRRIEEVIRDVDVAYIDGTFYAEGELPGRNLSEIPHPFIVESLERFRFLAADERAKIRFIHLNHTNPALFPGAALDAIEARGFRVAVEGDREPL
ncbi:MAG TPA: MBL fold metallo-hydrolase [Thermoanaerobaculia bacterium]